MSETMTPAQQVAHSAFDGVLRELNAAIREHNERAHQLRDARARIAWLEDCLRLIAAGSPPDEWKWYAEVPTMTGLDVHYLSHGKRGDQDFVAAPLRNSSESAHVHGWAVGRWEAAKLARAALAQEGK